MQTQKFKTLLKKNLLALKSMKRQKHNISKNVREEIFQITNNSEI